MEDNGKTLNITEEWWEYTCGDNCCYESGADVFINDGEAVNLSEGITPDTIKVLEHLGYTVNTENTVHSNITQSDIADKIKRLLDLRNWVKSELSNLTSGKFTKEIGPYTKQYEKMLKKLYTNLEFTRL